jgi:hypothetical protein
MMNWEMWNEVIMVCYKIISQHLPGETEENHSVSQSEWLVSGPRCKPKTWTWTWSRNAVWLYHCVFTGFVIMEANKYTFLPNLHVSVTSFQTAATFFQLNTIISFQYEPMSLEWFRPSAICKCYWSDLCSSLLAFRFAFTPNE